LVENKNFIRDKICSSLLLDQDLNDFFFENHSNLRDKLSSFRKSFPIESKKIFDLSFSGIGRGEALIYFLGNKVKLAGFSSNVDIMSNNGECFEVKTAKYFKSGDTFSGFKFGSDSVAANTECIKQIKDLIENTTKIKILNFSEIPKSKILKLKHLDFDETLKKSANVTIKDDCFFINHIRICNKFDANASIKIYNLINALGCPIASSFNEIEKSYFINLENEGFFEREFLFFDYDTGEPLHFGKIDKFQLQIERISQGQIRPMIKLYK
jgi:hypothetical protein